MADGGKAAFGTGERVFHGEVGPAGTVGRSVRGEPTISQGQSISEGTFMKGEAKLSQRKGGQPEEAPLS